MTDDPSLKGESSDKTADSPTQTGDDGAAQGPGPRLKEQRLQQGLSLDQVAQELRILSSILTALEENRFEVLEAPIFVRGHLKNYARLLGLPVDEIIQAYDRTLPEEVSFQPKVSHRPGPAMNSHTPRWIFAVTWLVILTLLVMAGLWWYAGPHRDPVAGLSGLGNNESTQDAQGMSVSPAQEGDDEIMPTAPRLDPTTDIPLSLPANEADDEDSPVALEGLSEEVARAAEDHLPDSPAPSEGVSPEGASVPMEPDAETDSHADNTRSLVLEVRDDSWLEVRAADEQQLFYGMARAGEQLELEGVPPLELFIGNAPAITLQVDGEPWDFSQRIRNDNTARVVVTSP